MPRNSQRRRNSPSPVPFGSAESENEDRERSNASMKTKSKQERLMEARARAKAWHYGQKSVATKTPPTAPRTKSKSSIHGTQDVKESKQSKWTDRASRRKAHAINSREDEEEVESFFDATDRAEQRQGRNCTPARRYSAKNITQTHSEYQREYFYNDGHQEEKSAKPVMRKKFKEQRLTEARARARAWSEKRKSIGTTTSASASQKMSTCNKSTSSFRGKARAVKDEEEQMSPYERELGPTGAPVKKKKAQNSYKRNEYPCLTADMEVEEMEVDEVWFDAREIGEIQPRAKKQSKAERRRMARERAANWAAGRKSVG